MFCGYPVVPMAAPPALCNRGIGPPRCHVRTILTDCSQQDPVLASDPAPHADCAVARRRPDRHPPPTPGRTPAGVGRSGRNGWRLTGRATAQHGTTATVVARGGERSTRRAHCGVVSAPARGSWTLWWGQEAVGSRRFPAWRWVRLAVEVGEGMAAVVVGRRVMSRSSPSTRGSGGALRSRCRVVVAHGWRRPTSVSASVPGRAWWALDPHWRDGDRGDRSDGRWDPTTFGPIRPSRRSGRVRSSSVAATMMACHTSTVSARSATLPGSSSCLVIGHP